MADEKPDKVRSVYEKLLEDNSSLLKDYGYVWNYKELRTELTNYSYICKFRDSSNSEYILQFEPYICLLESAILYNYKLYNKVAQSLKGQSIFKNKNGRSEKLDINISLLWKQCSNTMLSSAILFSKGLEFQAKQQLRVFIEAASLIFLLLTDFSFAEKYILNNYSEQDYQKAWWKHFKPSSVNKNLKTNKEKTQFESPENYDENLIRVNAYAISASFLEFLYQDSCDYIHLKNEVLFRHSHNAELNAFQLRALPDWSGSCNNTLVNLIEVFSQMTNALESAAQAHGISFEVYSTDDLFSYIHKQLVAMCAFEGLYDFGKRTINN